ncbi:MAG: hypothetical protein KGD73_04760 [Candidatus Lokiarchaeota archaeon]|nr:hypothetical protein [Candidatus Lokiarchaeota archaeon]
MPALAHFGIGLAAKRFFPKIPLWALLVSVMFLDLLSFIFIFTLWSTHGLLMAVVWTVIVMCITILFGHYKNSKKQQDKKRDSTLWGMKILQLSISIGFLVFSHWVLDFIGWPMSVGDPNATGTPLLFDDSIWIGLGVYTTWFGALTMDLGVFIAGLAIYLHHINKIKKIKIYDEIKTDNFS